MAIKLCVLSWHIVLLFKVYYSTAHWFTKKKTTQNLMQFCKELKF